MIDPIKSVLNKLAIRCLNMLLTSDVFVRAWLKYEKSLGMFDYDYHWSLHYFGCDFCPGRPFCDVCHPLFLRKKDSNSLKLYADMNNPFCVECRKRADDLLKVAKEEKENLA